MKTINHKPIALHGFNNLTKTLSFNLYDVCYAETSAQKKQYIEYIDEAYNAKRLTAILTDVAKTIDAEILHISSQDYEPQGASVTMLIAEGEPSYAVAHLDKSHITVHTYPEISPQGGICTFRADISVSTCGFISPLKALNFLLDSFETDIVYIDYSIRGFTRDIHGNKLYSDHHITSIQEFLDPKIIEEYRIIDVNVLQENIFHSKLILKELSLDHYLFGTSSKELGEEKSRALLQQITTEMHEIFHSKNLKTYE